MENAGRNLMYIVDLVLYTFEEMKKLRCVRIQEGTNRKTLNAKSHDGRLKCEV
jgi:hypothetical protein